MKRRLIGMMMMLIALAAMYMPASAAEELSVDAVHSSVMFQITHKGVAPFFGRFNEKSGEIVLDMEDPSASSISFSIDPASVDTANDKRNEHVMSPDFFSVKEFPVMSFQSTSISMNDDGSWNVTGDLEAHGVTNSISMRVTHTAGEGVHGFYTEFTINRMDFNIGETFDDASLSEMVTLYVSLEAN